MLSREMMEIAGPMIRTQRLIWGAFVVATLIYLQIGFVVLGHRTAASEMPFDLLLVLGPLAVLQLGGAFVFHSYLRGEDRLRKVMNGEPTLLDKTGGSAAISRPDPVRSERLPERERPLPSLLIYLQTTSIMVMAMVEAVAIYGLVLVITGKPATTMVPFVAGALVGLLLLYPRPEPVLEEAVKLASRR